MMASWSLCASTNGAYPGAGQVTVLGRICAVAIGLSRMGRLRWYSAVSLLQLSLQVASKLIS